MAIIYIVFSKANQSCSKAAIVYFIYLSIVLCLRYSIQETLSICDHGVVYKGGISINDGKVKPKTQTISSNPLEARFPLLPLPVFPRMQGRSSTWALISCIGLLQQGTHIYTSIMVSNSRNLRWYDDC